MQRLTPFFVSIQILAMFFAEQGKLHRCKQWRFEMIDFKKYSNPEIVNNIADVMSAPQRAPIRVVKWGLVFAVVGVVIDILMISFSNQQLYVTILSSIFLFFLMAFSGVLLGLYSFSRDLNRSLQTILEYANTIIHLVINDVCHSFDSVKSSVEGCRINLPSGHEIVSGVLVDVVNPAATKCLENKIPFVGKIASKAYSMAIDALLKISSVFFAKVDKEIDKVVNENLSKVKGIADMPLNFVEATVEKTWMPKITDGADKYIGKAKGYVHRTYFLTSVPIVAFAIAFIVAAISLTYFAL